MLHYQSSKQNHRARALPIRNSTANGFQELVGSALPSIWLLCSQNCSRTAAGMVDPYMGVGAHITVFWVVHLP